jgi:hypothetical protein
MDSPNAESFFVHHSQREILQSHSELVQNGLSLFPVDQVPCLCKDDSIWVGVLPAEMGIFHQQQVSSCM